MAEGPARILLVDDEQAVQRLLAYPLQKEGYEVIPAHDGREALDRFAEQRFDLVVLDIMLPELDGIEVCRRLRSPIALADSDRVAQIIRILLDNALTHTPEGTAITLTVKGRDGTAEFVVSDNGPGIEPQSRGRVFERFFTGDSGSGSGLGLAIARELAVRMRGGVIVASRRGRTDFTLVLPAEQRSSAMAGA